MELPHPTEAQRYATPASIFNRLSLGRDFCALARLAWVDLGDRTNRRCVEQSNR